MRFPAERKAVTFPDSTVVWGTPLFERGPGDPAPDYGLYMYVGWKPNWPHDFIDWPDLDVPSDDEDAAAKIIGAFERAQAGQEVEVGCHFGLGRTGTVIACMGMLAGIPSGDVVSWTKTNYRKFAVETLEQQQWIRRFEALTR